MKRSTKIIFVFIFTIFAILPGMILFNESASAQTDNPQGKNAIFKDKSIRRSPRIKRTISGADKPEQIPDNVAYELFLRTAAEGNARALVKRTGLTDEQVEKVLETAYSLDTYLDSLEKKAKQLKEKQTDATKHPIEKELLLLQRQKEDRIALQVKKHLFNTLKSEAADKLQNFIETKVKSS